MHRKENAKAILDGVKNVEFRTASKFYDKKVLNKDWTFKPIEGLIFRNYNNSFGLEVECSVYGFMTITEKSVKIIEEHRDELPFSEFSLNEFKEMVSLVGNEKSPQVVYFFIIDKVGENFGL